MKFRIVTRADGVFLIQNRFGLFFVDYEREFDPKHPWNDKPLEFKTIRDAQMHIDNRLAEQAQSEYYARLAKANRRITHKGPWQP